MLINSIVEKMSASSGIVSTSSLTPANKPLGLPVYNLLEIVELLLYTYNVEISTCYLAGESNIINVSVHCLLLAK